jgi:hypothetical protein
MKKESNLLCFSCDKEISPDNEKYFLGLDKPYINISFHRNCYKEIQGDINDFLLENLDKISELLR